MYQIIKRPNYYSGSLPSHPACWITESDVSGDDGAYNADIATWETEEEAQQWIDDQDDDTYMLANGEAGRPEYEIVVDCKIGEADCKPASGMVFDAWTEHEPTAEIKARLDALSVQAICDDYDNSDTMWYAAEIDGGDGYEYRIVYRPTSLALQLNNEDLGNITWSNAGYYRRAIES